MNTEETVDKINVSRCPRCSENTLTVTPDLPTQCVVFACPCGFDVRFPLEKLISVYELLGELFLNRKITEALEHIVEHGETSYASFLAEEAKKAEEGKP